MTLKKQMPRQVGEPGEARGDAHYHLQYTRFAIPTQPLHVLLLLAALWDDAAASFKRAGSYPKFELCRRRALMLRARWYEFERKSQ